MRVVRNASGVVADETRVENLLMQKGFYGWVEAQSCLKDGCGRLFLLFQSRFTQAFRRRLTALQVAVNECHELRLGHHADLGGFDRAILEQH